MQCSSMNRRIGDALIETSGLAKTWNGYPQSRSISAGLLIIRSRRSAFSAGPDQVTPFQCGRKSVASLRNRSFASQGAGRFRTMSDQHCLARLDMAFSLTVTDATDIRKKSLSFNIIQAVQQLRDNGGPGSS